MLGPDNPPLSLLATWRLQESERAGIYSVIGTVRFGVDVYLNSPKIVFDEKDERPIVLPYSEAGITLRIRFCRSWLTIVPHQKPKFKVGTKVYLHKDGTREGPYVVATAAAGKVTLCLANGELVRNGEEIDEDYVDL